jgi:nucleoside-diphosphate-sugar epimerase
MDSIFSGSRTLVTGASGFIGGALVQRLLACGAEVHAVSRRLQPSSSEITWHVTDLSAFDPTRELVCRLEPQYIFHLASHVSGRRSMDAVLPTLHNNMLSTVHLLAALPPATRRIIIAGSLEEPDGNITPSSPYAAAKWAATGYARMFHALYDTPVVLARLFMVYGPGQKDKTKLVPYVIRSILANQSPRLSSGTRSVDWIYVDDVIDGLLALASTPGIEGERFDIGSGSLVTVREVVECLCRLAPAQCPPSFGALEDRPFEQVRKADVLLTSGKTGWRPGVSLDTGMKNTIEWHRRNPPGLEY